MRRRRWRRVRRLRRRSRKRGWLLLVKRGLLERYTHRKSIKKRGRLLERDSRNN
jgi:hypothetical protein